MRHKPFEIGGAAAVGWEAAAYVTGALKETGRLSWRVPFISEVIRAQSLGRRLLIYVGLGLSFVEHIERMYLTRLALRLVRGAFSRMMGEVSGS